MNWKAEAMEKLQKYDAMRQATANIPEELKRLELAETSIRSATTDAAPVKGGGNKREDAVLGILVQKEELRLALEQAKIWLASTNRALGTLTPEERLVLHRFYIFPEKGSVDRLCGELGVEQSSVYRKRDRALHKFTLALYGITESA